MGSASERRVASLLPCAPNVVGLHSFKTCWKRTLAGALHGLRTNSSASGPSQVFPLEVRITRRMVAVPMSHGNSRKVFFVVAGGNPSAERHFEDTIQRKRMLAEVRTFLPAREIENLEKIYHGSTSGPAPHKGLRLTGNSGRLSSKESPLHSR
jgi:hypothetical protein